MVSRLKTPNFRLEWLIYGINVLVFVTWVGYLGYHDHRLASQSESQRLLAQANVVHDMMVRELNSINETLVYLRSKLPAAKSKRDRTGVTNERLKAFTTAQPSIRLIFITDASGTVLASSHDSTIGVNFSYREYFQTPRKNRNPDTLYASQPFKTVFNDWTIHLTRAIIGPRGEFAGIVSASLDPKAFNTLLNSVRYEADVRSGMVHGSGTLYMTSDDIKPLLGKKLNVPGSLFTRHVESGKSSNVFIGKAHLTGDERIQAIRTVQPDKAHMDYPFVIGVSRGHTPAHADCIRQAIERGAILLLLSISGAIALYMSQRCRSQAKQEQQESSQKLREAQKHLENFFNVVPDLLTICNTDGEFLELNSTWEQVFGYQLAELKNRPVLDFIHPSDIEASQSAISSILSGKAITGFVNRFLHKDGSYRHLEWHAKMYGGFLYSTARDVTDRVKIENVYRYRAMYDDLTALPNRALLIERLHQEIAHAKRERSQVALLFLDLDNFKPINDLHGHLVGDWLLREVALRILGCVRESDTVARISGDEFIILLPRVSQASNAQDVAENIRSALEQVFIHPENLSLEISGSIGVALYPDHADNVEDLMNAGDKGMYKAKNAGRNKVAMP